MLVWPISSSLSLSDPATRFIKVAKVWRQLWGVYFRRLTPSFSSIGVIYATGIQNPVEKCPVGRNAHSLAMIPAKYRARDLVAGQSVHNGLDFWGYSYHPVPAGVRLGAAHKGSLFAVIVFTIQSQKLRRSETQEALTIDIIGSGDAFQVGCQLVQSLQGECILVAVTFPVDHQVFSQVAIRPSSGDRVLIKQATQSFHVLTGPLALWAVVQALLQIVNGDVVKLCVPDRRKVLIGCFVAIQGGLGGLVGRQPHPVKPLKSDCWLGLFSCQKWQVLQSFPLCFEPGFRPGDPPLFAIVPQLVPHGFHRHPCAVGTLVDTSQTIAPGLGSVAYLLVCPALAAKAAFLRDLRPAFSALQKNHLQGMTCKACPEVV